MKRRETLPETSALIRWQFARGEQHLMCAVLAAPTMSSYEVATVPLWDVDNAALETFENPGAALQRHAAIAAGLRDAGWTLVVHRVKTDVPAAVGAGQTDSSTGASRSGRGIDVCQVPPAHRSDSAAVTPHLKNIREILKLETENNYRSLFDRLADAVSRVAGGLLFFVVHILWFAVWIVINRRPGAFDPPPFNLLMLIVSLEAILLTGFVLRAQSRAAMLADRRAEIDLQVNLLAEEELTAILRVVCALGDKVGIDVASADPRVEQFRSQTNVREIAAELDREKAVAESGPERIGREED